MTLRGRDTDASRPVETVGGAGSVSTATGRDAREVAGLGHGWVTAVSLVRSRAGDGWVSGSSDC